MRFLSGVWAGILAALFASLLVVGAITLAMTEGMTLPASASTPDVQPTGSLQTLFPELYSTRRSTPPPRLVEATSLPALPTCPAVPDWEPYTVINGDTLSSLAAARQVSGELVMEKNCLISSSLVAGSRLFLPRLAVSATPRRDGQSIPTASCGAPHGWINYRVQSGDTLFRLSTIYAVSVPELQQANCLGMSTTIRTGDSIYVPNVSPRYTATLTATPFTPTRTSTSTPTGLPSTQPSAVSRTATQRPSLTATSTASFTPTASTVPTTAVPTLSAPSGTSSPTATSTSTATLTLTPKAR